MPWYEYQKRTKTGQTWDSWGDTWTFVVPRLDSGKLRAEVSGLTNYTEYQFRVRAFNVGGPGSPSAPVSATPGAIPPPQPTNFAVTPGQGKMSLSWTNPAGIPLTGNSYRYRPKSTTDNGWTDWTGIPLATSHEVTGLTAGVLYTFRVRAHNASGASWPSYAAWAWTYPAAPRNLTATPGDRDGVPDLGLPPTTAASRATSTSRKRAALGATPGRRFPPAVPTPPSTWPVA